MVWRAGACAGPSSRSGPCLQVQRVLRHRRDEELGERGSSSPPAPAAAAAPVPQPCESADHAISEAHKHVAAVAAAATTPATPRRRTCSSEAPGVPGKGLWCEGPRDTRKLRAAAAAAAKLGGAVEARVRGACQGGARRRGDEARGAGEGRRRERRDDGDGGDDHAFAAARGQQGLNEPARGEVRDGERPVPVPAREEVTPAGARGEERPAQQRRQRRGRGRRRVCPPSDRRRPGVMRCGLEDAGGEGSANHQGRGGAVSSRGGRGAPCTPC